MPRHHAIRFPLAAASALSLLIATLGGAAVAQASSAVPVGPNLVANGSLDATPPAADAWVAYGTWGWYTALPGWSVCQGANPPVIEWGANWLGAAQSGTGYVELNSDAPSAICQTVSTVVGQTYRLSFYFSARPGTPAAANLMDVGWGGTNLTATPIAAGGTGQANTVWTPYSFDVTATSTSTALQFTDVGAAYTVGCGNCGSLLDTVVVQQLDTAPTVTSVTVPTSPLPAGAGGTVTATYTDPDVADSHTASVDCGNGSVGSGVVVTEPSGSTPGTVTATCPYGSAGVYPVTVTVTDAFSLSGSLAATTDVVVYDASAGFVTGGGWVTDAGGARASFGFVAKYQSGATAPVGSLESQSTAGNFHSVGLNWLVVSGDQAQLAGSGTLNGMSGYSFLLTVQDAALSGGSLPRDTFGLTITGPDNFSYSTAGGLLPIGGGNIQIHS